MMNNPNQKAVKLPKASTDSQESIIKQLNEAELILVSAI